MASICPESLKLLKIQSWERAASTGKSIRREPADPGRRGAAHRASAVHHRTRAGIEGNPGYRGEIRDVRRIAYLRKQIEQARLALAHGVPLIGYCTWSAFDLASTQNGYQKRYGLIYVDREDDDPKTARRIPKLSYAWFQKWFIASNGQDLELTEELNGESE